MSLYEVLKATVKEWSEDRASRLAAAFAYYAIFSIGPILMIAIAILGIIYGQRAATDSLRPQLEQFVGHQAAGFIQELVAKAGYSPGLSFAGILSIVLILYAATNLFTSLQDALNTIFDVEPKPGRGWRGVVKDRFLSFVMVLLVGAFILASVILTAILSTVTGHLHVGNPALMAFLIQAGNFLVSTLVFTGIFSMVFKYLPDIRIDWEDTLIGAAVTAAIFSLARIGLGYYLTRSSTAGPFGAAGSLVIVMLFIYYSAQILFFGAEFTQVWARHKGKTIRPSANAVTLDPQYTEAKSSAAAPATVGPTGHSDAVRRQGSGDLAAVARWQERGQSVEKYPAQQYHPPMQSRPSRAGVAARWIAAAALPVALLILWPSNKTPSPGEGRSR